MYAWDWLWGDADLLHPATGWRFVGAGSVGLLISYLLAQRLGLEIAEFLRLASSAERKARWIYNLPSMSVGAMIYGMLILSKLRR